MNRQVRLAETGDWDEVDGEK